MPFNRGPCSNAGATSSVPRVVAPTPLLCPWGQLPKERAVYGPSLAAARPDLATELRDVDPETIGPGSHRRVWWRCSHCGHEWEQPPAGRRPHPHGGGCRSCRARAALTAKQLARDTRGRLLPADNSALRGAAATSA